MAFAALGDSAARAWFTAQLISASGTMTQTVAMAWLVLRLTGSAADLGVLTMLTLGPVLVFGAAFGAVSDRVSRRALLILTQSAFIVLSIALFALALLDLLSIGVLFSMATATGVVTALDGPARQVYVRDLVGESRVASAVTLYEVTLNFSRIGGPMIGGVALGLWGAAWCFFFNAATYVPPLAVLVFTRSRGRKRSGGAAKAPGRMALRAAIRAAGRDAPIRYCLLLAAVSGTLFNTSLFFPVLAERAFGAGPGGYAALLGCFGIGALPGALAAASRDRPPSLRRVAILGWAAGALMIAAAVVPTLLACCLVLAVTGFVSIWFISAASTLVQLRSLAQARGGVMGLWTMALPGTNPVSAVLFGLLSDRLGVRESFGLAGALLAACALLALLRGRVGGGRLAGPALICRPAD